jgi:ribonuclease HII
VDEAGKGAVLGPMVVAAVCCHSEEECSRLGMRDSKTLSPARREDLYELVERNFTTAVVILSPKEIDQCLQETTLNVCLARAHAAVIQELRPGSGYPADPVTRAYLEHYIQIHHTPPLFARKSWKTVTEYLKSLHQRELTEF